MSGWFVSPCTGADAWAETALAGFFAEIIRKDNLLQNTRIYSIIALVRIK